MKVFPFAFSLLPFPPNRFSIYYRLVCMAHGYSQGVSRISTWRSGQLQKYAHHLLHLLFIGITIPYNSLFYHPWRIVMHLQTIMQGCQNGNSSGMPQFQGRTRVCSSWAGIKRSAGRLLMNVVQQNKRRLTGQSPDCGP